MINVTIMAKVKPALHLRPRPKLGKFTIDDRLVLYYDNKT